MIRKFEFLKKNWEEIVEKIKEIPTNAKETLKENGHSFIGYCLAKRFQFVFNDEGQAKTKFYKDNNSYLLKYATEINGILGPRRVNLEYYKELENKFKENIRKLKTNNQKEAGTSTETEKLGKMIDLILNDYWGNICAIDRDNVQFEKADEWALQTVNTILNDNFNLVDLKFADIDPNDFNHLNKASNEWANFKNGALERFNLHKLTFTEAHIIIASFHKNLTDHLAASDITSIIQKEIQKNIYWQLKEEIEKLKTNKNGQQELIVEKELSRVETSIELKEKLKACGLSVYVLKFVLNENQGEERNCLKSITRFLSKKKKELSENMKKYLENFKNKCGEEIKENKELKELNKLVEDNTKLNEVKNNLIIEINKFENKLNEKIKKLEKKNLKREFKKNEDLEEKLETETKEYIGRLKEKLAFLVGNYEKLIDKDSTSQSNGQINTSSLSAIIYCLANKFLEMFNEDGVVNMDILLQNISNTNLIEYGMEMNEKLGKKRVDKMYYQQILKMIGENSNVELKKLKENWSNYCYIDKQNVEFERPEEWALQYKNEIGLQEDGFRLAYLGEGNDALLLAINDRENGLTTKQKEEIFKEILSNFHLHKVTFLEAHKMLGLSNSTTKTPSEIAETSSSQKENETYKKIKFEMRKVFNFRKKNPQNFLTFVLA
ncbi:unnamed protein product [Meloidogyne enterolobii]|uniref:Uncharacterized protein n=1 Tax=Meloidogyne enterolobii TaxID=390850 RepID=A0ACB1A757_MELEN